MTDFATTIQGLGIAQQSRAPVAASATPTLGQGDFLKLMTAQLNNQDPFAPVDNTQMVAQMAQFSSLAGISEMSTTLKAISDKLGATTTADATAYIGKNVLTEGQVAYPRASGGIAGGVELDAAASNVTVTIASDSGQILKSLKLGAQAAGTASFDWDGMTDAGDQADGGPYHVSVTAQDAGKSVTARPLVWAPVQSVAIPATGAPVLTLPGVGQVPTTAVRQIG